MIADWELWACADTVLRQHGDHVRNHINERVMSLGRAGDKEGVQTWLAIADRVDQLVGLGAIRH